ncbi:MAG: peptidoglycan DD-metalloendopeptidase family protein [Candidatus Tectomicrobia bacterium]|nr:peptidoglycan DD-metalloendopeptidase family protein [Candidatus Tectomicrobia bacterium]
MFVESSKRFLMLTAIVLLLADSLIGCSSRKALRELQTKKPGRIGQSGESDQLREIPQGRHLVHLIQRGETLSAIARRYNVDLAQLVEANKIPSPNQIRAGEMLMIPGVPYFIWPLQSEISSQFGRRGRRRHTGIDLLAEKGTSIRAAADGQVIFSGSNRGYGNIVMIRHFGGFVTVYAHNKANLVKVGQYISQGKVIAKVGDTGNATSPHLHFEVRKYDTPLNPVFFLPGIEVASSRLP